MADITKCTGENCPQKGTCHRFTANENELRQSYFVDPPIVDGKCEYYWGKKAEYTMRQIYDILKGES